jgi:hypothetical protein
MQIAMIQWLTYVQRLRVRKENAENLSSKYHYDQTEYSHYPYGKSDRPVTSSLGALDLPGSDCVSDESRQTEANTYQKCKTEPII